MKAKRIISRIFFAFCILIILLIIGRVFLLSDNDSLTDIHPTVEAVAGYKNGDEFMTHDVFESIANDGYFSANGLIWNESTGELQLTGRYNDSLFTYMDCPETTEFTWKLVDKANETEYPAEVVASEKKYFYNYRKLIFSDVKIENNSELYLFLVYEDKYPLEETEGLFVHYPEQEFDTYKLSKDEITDLEN